MIKIKCNQKLLVIHLDEPYNQHKGGSSLMKFGENLQNLRKEKRISQETLAEKMDVSRQSVSKWERGESYPTMNNILTLCEIFHCKLNDLVHEEITDFHSLDEEIQMNVVKFKKEKQDKMKGLSKAIYVLARIGKIMITIAFPFIILCMILLPYLVNSVEVVNNEIQFKGSKDAIVVEEETLEGQQKVTVKYKGILIADATEQETILKMKEVLTKYSNFEIIGYLEAGFLFLAINLFLYCWILKHLEKLFMNINNGDTPFTLENVKHMKHMAFLMIATIVLPNLAGAAFELILQSDLGVGFELFDVVQILFLFSMAYIFEYGYEIQLDSKGKMYGEEE